MDSITLTRDELYVFLALLGLRTVSGLPQNLAAGLADEEAEIRFNCGELTLYERGLLTYAEEQRPVPHDLLIALVGTAALPQTTLLLQQTKPREPHGRSTAHFFSRRPGLLVEHSAPRPGLYQFQFVAGDAFADRVRALTASLPTWGAAAASEGKTCWSVSAGSMADFLNRSGSGDTAGAAAALVQGGLPQPVARDMAASLRTHPHWIAAGGRQLNGAVAEAGTVAGTAARTVAGSTALIIAGEGGCRLVHSETGSGEQVQVHSLSGQECQEWLLAFAAGLIEDSEQEGEDAQLAAELE